MEVSPKSLLAHYNNLNGHNFTPMGSNEQAVSHIRRLCTNFFISLRPSKRILLKVHKIEIFFGFDFEICNISLLGMSKY